uniref:Uncharacterized protein n=1 Tax=Magallana gigas TaxID=29159 RepID=A0A8W8MLB9_MAGGI
MEAWWKERSLLPFHSPVTAMIVGPTMSGKTSFVYEILKHADGLPSKDQIDKWSEGVQHTVSVLYDMMMQVAKSEESLTLFCVTAHHRRISVFMLAQNLYMPGKFAGTISLNCHYVIIFRNVRDSRQVFTFGSQVFPLRLTYSKEAGNKATSIPFGYLVVDMSPGTEDKYRSRTHILPNEDTIV